ncbi:MAG: fibrillarin-like rRNA/tRNA 2'-O-methyltransferase [Candidatus Micrarchaeota archaeon]
MVKEKFPGVYEVDGKNATLSLAPGFKVYDERVKKSGSNEYRFWDPYKSKLAAAMKNGLKTFPIPVGAKVLYLGAASGTTASHVSDVVGRNGVVYCVEFAPRTMRELIQVCEKRGNMLPILADARHPEEYGDIIRERVDVIYEDVAQPDQAEIMRANARSYLKKNGFAALAVKSQSIDVTKKPKEVYEGVIAKLKYEFEIMERINLEPFEKDHLFLNMTYRL